MVEQRGIVLYSECPPDTCLSELAEDIDVDERTFFSLSRWIRSGSFLGWIAGDQRWGLHRRIPGEKIVCFLFAFALSSIRKFSTGAPMSGLRTSVPSCAEHERLAFELLALRTRGQCLGRLRGLTRQEQAEWDRRERAALSRLADHEREHGCGR
jgi:hypothetical protein